MPTMCNSQTFGSSAGESSSIIRKSKYHPTVEFAKRTCTGRKEIKDPLSVI